MDTECDIRRRTLEEAAIEVYGYCRGASGHEGVPVKLHGRWEHMFLVGNGSNLCAAGSIHEMIVQAKATREEMRHFGKQGGTEKMESAIAKMKDHLINRGQSLKERLRLISSPLDHSLDTDEELEEWRADKREMAARIAEIEMAARIAEVDSALIALDRFCIHGF